MDWTSRDSQGWPHTTDRVSYSLRKNLIAPTAREMKIMIKSKCKNGGTSSFNAMHFQSLGGRFRVFLEPPRIEQIPQRDFAGAVADCCHSA